MKYQNVIPGRFLSRANRFIAQCEIDGAIETVHVKNTGRLKELLVPGAPVYLSSRTTQPGKPVIRWLQWKRARGLLISTATPRIRLLWSR